MKKEDLIFFAIMITIILISSVIVLSQKVKLPCESYSYVYYQETEYTKTTACINGSIVKEIRTCDKISPLNASKCLQYGVWRVVQ